MSDGYGSGTGPSADIGGDSSGADSTLGTARSEAAEVSHTAADAAKDVAHTAKDEAKSVAGETKNQLHDLYARGRSELSDQAASQQQRIATGLQSAGDELRTMADKSDGDGIAADVARRASQRISSAGSWLEQRDPAAVLDEVRQFARRRPAVFIAGAAVAGVVVGRLVRALASNQHDASAASGASDATAPTVPAATTGPEFADPVTDVDPTFRDVDGVAFADPVPDADTAAFAGDPAVSDDGAPLYDRTAADASGLREGVAGERRDSL